MKTRRLSYWIGLFCLAVLVLMPDITAVNAQTEPGEQGSNGQLPNEVGQGTGTQTSEGHLTSEENQPPEEKQTSEENQPPEENQISKGQPNRDKAIPTEEEHQQVKQRRIEEGQRLLDAGCHIGRTITHPSSGEVLEYIYVCPAGFSVEGLMREGEQSLIESGCQNIKTGEIHRDGSVWNVYDCPPGSDFYHAGAPGGGGRPGAWQCLVSPDPAYVQHWMVNGEHLSVDADVMSGECVPPLHAPGGIRERITEDGQSPREVNVQQIREPASSDSQGEGDQQQAQDDVAQVDDEARGEKAQGEENKASDQSQENNTSKKGYGCSANP